MSTLELEIPRDWWMTSNQRLHWAAKAKRTRWIRQAATHAAKTQRVPRYRAADVTAYIAYPRNNRADPDNAHPTVKAAIDGLVDAGIFPDDDSEHVTGTTYRRDAPTGRTGIYRVRLVLTRPAKETTA